MKRQVAAAADDHRLDEIVDARHHQDAPGDQEHRPAGVAVVEEPDCRRPPDQRRPDRQRREEEGRETQQRRRRNAREPQADPGQHPLRERRAQNAVDDAAHGPHGDLVRRRPRSPGDVLDARGESAEIASPSR